MRARERMTAAQKYGSCTLPSSATSSRVTMARRSTSGLSEQMPADSASGSMEIARFGR